MQKEEHYVVLPLLFLALFSMAFLFGVSYTSASFSGSENSMPDFFGPSQISASFDRGLTVVADNLKWSLVTAVEVSKGPVADFFGMTDYQYGQTMRTAIASQPVASAHHSGAVLGIVIINPDYSTSVSTAGSEIGQVQ